MPSLGLEKEIVDQSVYRNSVQRFRDAKILLPTFAQLAEPQLISDSILEKLKDVGREEPHPLNLFRVHWYNDSEDRGFTSIADYVELSPELTGVNAKIVVIVGEHFPMIDSHKVLAAYGCLAPRVITGQFDPTRHRAVWPSTGNYCRGGVAISRIMQCRGVAILPEGMSRERFHWLEDWVEDPQDVIPTPGTESNVKEIYDKCHELDVDPKNIIFNQFSEFGNHLVHYECTGRALSQIFEENYGGGSNRLRAMISATGSGGTIAAGDYLKEIYGSLTVGVEALECPTLLKNGFGEHNIQGIGDKHVPLIHNVMDMDMIVAISDRSTDELNVLFNHPEGRKYLLRRQGISEEIVGQLGKFGLSSICNILAAIKTAKYYKMGSDDVILTVATDGAAMYDTERDKTLAEHFSIRGFDEVHAGEVFGRHLLGMGEDHLLECNLRDKERIFDLGYYTWVEQQGVSIEEFVERRRPSFWKGLKGLLPAWDTMIDEFNHQTGMDQHY